MQHRKIWHSYNEEKKIKYNPEQTQFLELVDKEMNRVIINTVDPWKMKVWTVQMHLYANIF